MSSSKSIAVIITIGLVLGSAGPTSSQISSEHPVRVLLNDFESVVFADASLFRSDVTRFGRIPKEILSSLRSPFGILFMAFEDPALSALRGALLHGTDIRTVVVGARNFRAPQGVGPVLADVCYLLQLNKNPLRNELSLLELADQVDGIAIRRIRLEVKRNAPSVLFVVQPTKEHLLLATDLEIAKSVVTKLLGKASNIYPPSGLSIARSSPYWCYRSYQVRTNSDAVAGGMVIGNFRVGPNASALVFHINVGTTTGTLQYLTADEKDRAALKLNGLGFSFGEIRPKLWESSILLSDDRVLEQLFGIFMMFGFGAYL